MVFSVYDTDDLGCASRREVCEKMMIKMLLTSFLLTFVIEWGIGLLWKIREKSDWYVIFLANLITNPILVMVQIWGHFFLEKKTLSLLIFFLECIAWILEGLIYHKKMKNCRFPYGYAVAANLLSYSAGWLISGWI